jgi:hypothetical protein
VAAAVAGWERSLAAEGGAGAQPHTRSRVSYAHSRCCETTTCVPDPGHYERPADRRPSNSVRDGEGWSLGVGSSRGDRRSGAKKIFCSVTTRRRKLGVANPLRRRLGSLAARFLGLGVPSSDLDVLTMPGLPPRCLPATNLLLTLRMLAVALVVTPRLIFAATAFTQASPPVRSAPSSRSATSLRTLTIAHGSSFSQGKARGGCSRILPERDHSATETLARRPIDLSATRPRSRRL